MGELRTRKRGKSWEWSFEGARIQGKRQPISKSGYRTKADAIAAGTKAKAEYDNAGRVFRPSEISVADYMDYWYKNYVCKHLKYNTQLSYERVIRLHIKPALGKYRLAPLEDLPHIPTEPLKAVPAPYGPQVHPPDSLQKQPYRLLFRSGHLLH